MRVHNHFASLFVLGAVFAIGCGGGSGGTGEDVETGVEDSDITDTSGGEVEVDTGTIEDSFNPMLDTGAEAAPDTSLPDTAPVDTGAPDTGAPDTGPIDTGTPDTGPIDTGTPDTTPVDSATCVIGGPCDDSNACTTGETYNSACVCTGGTTIACDDTNVCTTDTCVPATGCKFTAIDGTTCGAGKKCTSGVCSDLCVVGATCEDGNACTIGETFDSTCACVGGTARVCDDSNECTTNSCVPATGCSYANVPDTTACGGVGSPNTCKMGVCTPPPAPPTIVISTPTEGTMKPFDKASPSCNALPVTITATAPGGFLAVSYHLFGPTFDGSQMTGSGCGVPSGSPLPPWHTGLGKPIFPFKITDSHLTGKTTVTGTINLDAFGNYGGVAPWLFCTEPGTGGTLPLTALDGSAIPAVTASAGGLRSLANYCHSDNSNTDPGRAWTLLVRVVDKSGASVTAERKFTVHDE